MFNLLQINNLAYKSIKPKIRKFNRERVSVY